MSKSGLGAILSAAGQGFTQGLKNADNQAFVASNEVDSGTLETKEVCRLLKEAGKTEANAYIIMGELSNQAAVPAGPRSGGKIASAFRVKAPVCGQSGWRVTKPASSE